MGFKNKMCESNKYFVGEGFYKELDINVNFQEYVYVDDWILEMYVLFVGLLNLKIMCFFYFILVSL